jgi:general secretion pathway protein M
MDLGERMRQLEPRERQLLGILLSVVAVMFFLAVPVGVSALLASKRSDNQALEDVIEAIQAGRASVAARDRDKGKVAQRYANAAPPLASLLEKLAAAEKIEIPESQDRPVVPHGKRFEERSTKIVLHKVGMLPLVKFLEKLEQSGHPVSVSRLNIRKRGTEPDSYDVELIVSAFDRKAEEKKPAAKDEKKPAAKEPSEP